MTESDKNEEDLLSSWEKLEKERRHNFFLQEELRAQYEAAAQSSEELAQLREELTQLRQEVRLKEENIHNEEMERISIGENLKSVELLKDSTLSKLEESEMKRVKSEEELKRMMAVVRETENCAEKSRLQLLMIKKSQKEAAEDHKREKQKRLNVDLRVEAMRKKNEVSESKLLFESKQAEKLRRKVAEVERENSLLKYKASKLKDEAVRASTEARLGRTERERAERVSQGSESRLNKQDWLIRSLLESREKQLEDAVRTETEAVNLAGEVERCREVALTERRHLVTCQTDLAATDQKMESLVADMFGLKRQVDLSRNEVKFAESEKHELDLKIEALRKEIVMKEKEMYDAQRVSGEKSKEASELRAQLTGLTYDKCQADKTGQEALKSLACLQSSLQSADNSEKRLSAVLEKERHTNILLSSELCRRTDEVKGLKDRCSLLLHVLQRGNKEYNYRLKDIGTLTREVLSLREEVAILLRQVGLTHSLKTELTRMQRELVASYHRRAVLEKRVMLTSVNHPRVKTKVSDVSKYSEIRSQEILLKKYLNTVERLASAKEQVLQSDKRCKGLEEVVRRGKKSQGGAQGGDHALHIRALHAHIQDVQAKANDAILQKEISAQENKKNRQKAMERITTKRNTKLK